MAFWGKYFSGRKIDDVFLPGDEEIFGDFVKRRYLQARTNLDSGYHFYLDDDDDYILVTLQRLLEREEKRNQILRGEGNVDDELDMGDVS